MPVVRVYVPVGGGDLSVLAETGTLPAGPARPRTVYAVTPELERSAPGLDVEDLEYAAFSDAVAVAAEASDRPGDLRVVAAADVDPAWVSASDGLADGSASAMALLAPLPLSRVASFHVDEKAPAATPPGATGSTGGDADDLLWYDATELDEVRGLLG